MAEIVKDAAGKMLLVSEDLDSNSSGSTGATGSTIPGRLISARTQVPRALSDGANASEGFMWNITPRLNARNVRLVYGNFYIPGSGAKDAAGPNAIIVSASWFGKDSMVTWGGLSTVTIPAGQIAVSDPCPVELHAGTAYYLTNTVAGNILGDKWPLGLYLGLSNERKGVNGGTLNISTARGFGPLSILADCAYPAVAVALVGDSITEAGGSGDTQDFGWPRRVADLFGAPWVKCAGGGDSMKTTNIYEMRHSALVGCSDAIAAYGANDMATDLPAAQGKFISTWQRLAEMGMRVAQSTVLPRGTGSSPVTGFAPGASTRSSINEWLRAGAPLTISGRPGAYSYTAAVSGADGALLIGDILHPCKRLLDICLVAESGRDTNNWAPGFSGDNVHPNATGATAIAAWTQAEYPDLFWS